MSSWQTLGAVAPDALHDARLVLHYAAQLPSALGTSWLPAREDFSHTNLRYSAAARALVGEPIDGFSGALRLHDMTLCVVDSDDRAVAEQPLAGQTMAAGLSWLGDAMIARVGAREGALKVPEHDMPESPIAVGAALAEPAAGHFGELAHYFANAAELIGTLARERGGAPVRCWPHHFDIATLISLDKDKSGEEARTVGIGLSPGDGGYDQPYFYVTPWPYPAKDKALPELPLGAWHTEGWIGAVLQASDQLDQQDQAGAAARFLSAAADACIALQGEPA